MITRFLLILCAAALVLVTTAQMMPRAFETANAMTVSEADAPADCPVAASDGGEVPCKAADRQCVNLIGCALMVAVPAFASVEVTWGDVAYLADEYPLSGRSFKPDPTPPIVPA